MTTKNSPDAIFNADDEITSTPFTYTFKNIVIVRLKIV